MIKTDDIITTDGYLEFCDKTDIDYIKTDFFYIGSFMWRGSLHPQSVGRNIVIGHSDYSINDSILCNIDFENIFCINKDTNNNNVHGIPLGITNDCDDSPMHRVYGNREIMIDVMNDTVEKNTLAYLNFNISNYPNERNLIFNNFSKENWVLVSDADNTLEGRKKYLYEIKSSKFVFCPRGNGIDTHRLWETLYMGSYPIVKYEKTHELFTDLPILFINDWNEINEDFLNKKYEDFNKTDWNLNKLKLSYWTDYIINTIENK